MFQIRSFIVITVMKYINLIIQKEKIIQENVKFATVWIGLMKKMNAVFAAV